MVTINRVILFGFLGSMAVLVIMHASNFADAVKPLGDIFTTETKLLSGNGYDMGAKTK
jgi:hypothetical protein